MTDILSFVNLKGGVGKTALAVNFAAICGSKNLRTLLIDVDPQTNATFSCISVSDWDQHQLEHGSIADLMGMRRHTAPDGARRDPNDVIISDVFDNVDLIPSHLDLFTIDLDLAGATSRETKLRRALEEVVDNYDMVVCDCPPNLTIPTQNALAMSTHFAVPVSPDYLSALGIGILLNRVREYCTDLEHTLEHIGIIISRHGRPARHRTETVEDLRGRFPDLVLETVIKERVAVSEATEANRPVFQMSDAEATAEFDAFASELLLKMGCTS